MTNPETRKERPMKFASWTLYAVVTALLCLVVVRDASPGPGQESHEYLGAIGADAWTPPLTGELKHNVGDTIPADGSTSFAIPKWDPAHVGTLIEVELHIEVRPVPPVWYPGQEPYGFAFKCRDLADDDTPECAYWGFGCPVDPNVSEGDPGGPWTKARASVAGVAYIGATLEAGATEVCDGWDAFGGTTYELKQKNGIGEDTWSTTSDLDRWTGAGNVLWDLTGTYGGNSACSSTNASATTGWSAEVKFSVAYTYEL